MKKLTTILAWGLKKLWLVLAVLLVLFAVLLSAMRYALPHLEQKKALLEEYVSERYGVALTIGSLQADWQKTGPAMVLKQVSLKQSASSPVGLDIRTIDIELDFWRSLTHRQLSSNQFTLSGLQLALDADRLTGGADSDFPVLDALKSLFLEQLENFSVTDSTLSITQEGQTQVVDISALRWLNSRGHHQGQGAFQVRELANNSASFIIDLDGGKDNLHGVLYAKAEDLDISPWVSGLIKTRRPLNESRANLELWAEVENSTISALFTQLHDSHLEWGGEDEVSVSTSIRSGTLQALPVGQQWQFRLDELVVESNDQSLTTDLVGRMQPGREIVLNTMKPTPVNPFLVLLPLFTSDTADDDVRELNPQGELSTLQLQIKPKGVALSAKLVDVSWQQFGNIPGVDALDIGINWSKSAGVINIAAREGQIHADNLLSQNLALDTLRAKLFVYPQQQTDGSTHMMLASDNLQLQTNLFGMQQSFRFDLFDRELSLMTTIDDLPVATIPSLLPGSLMGADTAAYLTRALSTEGQNGQISHARIMWQGQLADYPFTRQQGVFQAGLSVTDSQFSFASGWPALDQADLALLFENKGLTITGTQAKLNGVNFKNLTATIAQLEPSAHLIIHADGQGSAAQLTDLMVNSTLADSLGMVLDEQVQISGDLQASLKLDIPLNSPDVVASGSALLTGNKVYINSLGMTLEEAAGEVRFINENINTDHFTAQLLGQPVNLDVTGGKHNDEYRVDVGLQGNWSIAPLLARINPEFTQYVKGHSEWQANVALQLPTSGFSYSASITSQLAGIASSLPPPLNKSATQIERFAITSQGNQKASTIRAVLGQEVAFDGILPHSEMQFSRAHLALGDSDFSGLGVGFSVSANLPQVSMTDWYQTVQLIIDGTGAPDDSNTPASTERHITEPRQPALFSVPERIFVNTDKLIIAGQTLTDVDITAKQTNNNWFVDIDSSEARAKVNLYEQWLTQGIEVDADYINLVSWQPTDETVDEPSQPKAGTSPNSLASSNPPWDAQTLPPIYFHCRQCTFMGKQLGEVTLDVAKSAEGMSIQQFQSVTPHSKLNATGEWLMSSNRTHIEGNIDSNDVGTLLKDLGVNSGIKDSAAAVSFNLHWANSPMDFALAGVNGDVDWRLTDGYLSELSDKGSRIFTLFSLNSLVRKLSLDFRDVFAKGFFYDDMRGTLNIHDGKAATDDTIIDGGAGEIVIKGYTDLVAQQLNYNVAFTPNVTGNLPILVYFLATPPTALAALALDQVLTSAKVISNVNYKVTGTLSEPKFEEMGRDSKDIQLPARQTSPDPDPGLTQPDLERLNLEVQHGKSGSRANDVGA
ncbi:YhdP family protein [Salinimonas sediminis]|uniref:TIGR02099 family protein n=1 Tax=Salinimonas sediminis TaxID=2303538 RepID=A0A346NRE8_9ALTE|nr:YhdP family protein [Salinimonas sediminis]AXR08105.1 TIGR02099 family protein [Salinimonas sediminis]